MKFLLTSVVIMVAVCVIFAADAPLPDVSAETLAKIKTSQGKDLPLKPEEILDLKATVTYKKVIVTLKSGQYTIKLNDKEKEKLAKKKVGLFRICSDVFEQEEGQPKANKRLVTGRANLLILDLVNSKVILNTTESLARLCPS